MLVLAALGRSGETLREAASSAAVEAGSLGLRQHVAAGPSGTVAANSCDAVVEGAQVDDTATLSVLDGGATVSVEPPESGAPADAAAATAAATPAAAPTAPAAAACSSCTVVDLHARWAHLEKWVRLVLLSIAKLSVASLGSLIPDNVAVPVSLLGSRCQGWSHTLPLDRSFSTQLVYAVFTRALPLVENVVVPVAALLQTADKATAAAAAVAPVGTGAEVPYSSAAAPTPSPAPGAFGGIVEGVVGPPFAGNTMITPVGAPSSSAAGGASTLSSTAAAAGAGGGGADGPVAPSYPHPTCRDLIFTLGLAMQCSTNATFVTGNQWKVAVAGNATPLYQGEDVRLVAGRTAADLKTLTGNAALRTKDTLLSSVDWLLDNVVDSGEEAVRWRLS